MRTYLSLLIIFLCFDIAWADTLTNFSLKTNAFLDEGVLPVLYSCDGKDVSPELFWDNPPKNTKSFVLLTTLKQAGKPVYEWVIYNLPAVTKKLDEDIKTLPSGAMAGKNADAKLIYVGPCPAKGTTATIIFTLYALDTTLNVGANADGETIENAMQKHIIDKTKISAVYSRWNDTY